MALSFAQFGLVLLFVASGSAQLVEFCPLLGGVNSINWNVNQDETLEINTLLRGVNNYGPSMDCTFSIEANAPGRIIVRVIESNLQYYAASISIRTYALGGYLASWSQLTYDKDRDDNFIGLTNKLYINFNSRSSPPGNAAGVRLLLTFMRANGCPPRWTPMTLDGRSQCVGVPTQNVYKFGAAQRYCNLQRSNLLISERDNIATVLQRANAANVWIGMTAEPSGSYSTYRWINNIRVAANHNVSCTGGCRPGSTTHRCVYARDPRSLIQIECGQSIRPACFMPVGGTDTFYAGSAAVRASDALLAGAVLLLWGLLN
ncbi:hypothetical protein BOX15_Mlig016263g3 [Macrostomum lignano]|uniref:C-type lectin domain-containing protein n=1 Tax=Macrostomum lignano TaxID=282301 RepID=A0A267E1A1_9PLAT|nr:hypothetical protein BOX15_Mlig016263g3 [Macrostomum lignano]